MASSNAIAIQNEPEIILGSEKLLGGKGAKTSISQELETYVPPGSTSPVITWENLTVETSNAVDGFRSQVTKFLGVGRNDDVVQPKVILDNISGQIQGGLHAIIGASGCGKTSLLNAISCRLDKLGVSSKGSIYLNGRLYTSHQIKKISGYVMQDDVLHSVFTVDETLWYHANLRLGGEMTYQERLQRIKSVLLTLGLENCKHVMVGDSRNKGISGGQRKRLCIAIELLRNPSILFLDEPTSGLDSLTAFELISTFREVVEQQPVTIVCTIHQPQKKLFELFHNITLMRAGEIVYQGNTFGAASYFTMIGYPKPAKMNPAEHILDVLSLHDVQSYYNASVASNPEAVVSQAGIELVSSTNDKESDGDENKKTMTAMDTTYINITVDSTVGLTFSSPDELASKHRSTPWALQFGVLLLRGLHEHWRRRFEFILNIISIILVAIFVGYGTWAHLGTSLANLSKRPAVLFYCTIHQGLVFSYQSAYLFPKERAIMLRERQSNAYQVSAYFLGKCVADMVYQLPCPVIFSLLVYHQVGLQDSSQKLRIFIWLMVLTCQAATAMTAMISTIFVSLELTVVVMAVSFEITRLFGGWFVSPILLQKLYQWKFADALSYLKYGFIGVSLNEYTDLVLDCTPAQIAEGTAMCTGNRYLRTFGYDQYTISQCVGYLIVLIVGFRLMSYLALRTIKI